MECGLAGEPQVIAFFLLAVVLYLCSDKHPWGA